jgi:hypothetical protein
MKVISAPSSVLRRDLLRHFDLARNTKILPSPRAFRALVIIGVLAVATTLALSLLRFDSVRHQLKLSFTRMPSKYSELYFADMPATIISPDGENRQLLADFVVSNHEGDSTNYGYVAEVVNDVRQQIARVSGSVLVPNDAVKTTAVEFDFPSEIAWSSMEVRLTGRSEVIRYLNGVPS